MTILYSQFILVLEQNWLAHRNVKSTVEKAMRNRLLVNMAAVRCLVATKVVDDSMVERSVLTGVFNRDDVVNHGEASAKESRFPQATQAQIVKVVRSLQAMNLCITELAAEIKRQSWVR